MRGSFGVAVVALGALIAVGTSAQGAPSDRETATRAYEEGQLDRALTLFESALRTTRDDPAHLADVYLHLGILNGLRGQAAEAQRNYEYALALVPSLAAPAELGPRDREPFLRALQARAGREFRIELDVDFGPGEDVGPRVDVRVFGAPEGLLARTRVVAISEGHELWTRESVPGEPSPGDQSSAWDRSKPLTLRATGLNEFGAELVTAVSTIAPRSTLSESAAATPGSHVLSSSDGEPPETPAPRRRRLVSSPWFWIATALVVGGGATAGYFLLRPEDRIVVSQPTFAVRE